MRLQTRTTALTNRKIATADQFILNKQNLNFDWSDVLNKKLMMSTFWCVCRVDIQFSNSCPE